MSAQNQKTTGGICGKIMRKQRLANMAFTAEEETEGS